MHRAHILVKLTCADTSNEVNPMHIDDSVNAAPVDTNIPIPARYKATSKGIPVSITESIRKLGAGHSFVLDDPRMRPSVSTCARRLKIPVQTKKTEEGLRVWRVG